jgi:SAM-dependent methyltransferase
MIDEKASIRQRRRISYFIEYAKQDQKAYSANNYESGYHTLDILGKRKVGQRAPVERLNLMGIDFRGKTLLDVGCNEGGMLYPLSHTIKWGVGIDYNYKLINLCNAFKSVHQYHNLDFFVSDLDREPLNLFDLFIPAQRVDIVFFLSMAMWLKNWQLLLRKLSEITTVMVFETNGTDAQQRDQENGLRQAFQNVTALSDYSLDDQHQRNRKLFRASH